MTLAEYFSRNIFFYTRDFAQATGMTMEGASRKLARVAESGGLQKVTRGVWAQHHHAFYSPYGAVPYILGNEQGYISFLTALHRHGAISQIPSTIQIATTGRGRVLESPIGVFEFFHMQSKGFWLGVEPFEGKLTYNLATPEKALIDTIYISLRKGRRFSHLPELDRSAFRESQFNKWLKMAPSSVQRLVLPTLRSHGYL